MRTTGVEPARALAHRHLNSAIMHNILAGDGKNAVSLPKKTPICP